MSKKRKNFHYHYAERYESPAERRARLRKKQRFVVPPIALFISVVLLAVFGLVSTTFSVYVTNSFDDPDLPASGGLVVEVKNTAVREHLKSTTFTPAQNTAHKDSDLADTGAQADLAETGWSYGGKKVYIKPEGNWKLNNEKYRFRVWNSNGNAMSAVATQYGSTAYYVTTIPSGTYTGAQWVRVESSNTSNIWNYGANWNGTSNAYWDNGSSNSQYQFWTTGTVVYFDCTGGTDWDGSSAKIFTQSSTGLSSGGYTTTQVADHLYKFTFGTDWDNAPLIWYRGSNASNLWNYTASMTAFDATVAGNNCLYVTGGVSNGSGSTAALSLTSLTKPTLGGDGDVYLGDATHTFSVTNDSSVKLNYSRGGSSKTTGLIDKKYTYYLDGTALGSATTSSSYTFSSRYFAGNYGEHTLKVKVSSAASGLSDVMSDEITFTVNNPDLCAVKADGESLKEYANLTVNTPQAVPITAVNHTGNITVTGVANYILVSADNATYSLSATVQPGSNVYLKPLQPTSSAKDVTVACAAGHANSSSATIRVTSIEEPSINVSNASYSIFYDSDTAIGTVTPSPNTAENSPTYSVVTAANSNAGVSTLATITDSNTKIAGTGNASDIGSAQLKITVQYNSVYTAYKYLPITISDRPACYLDGLGNGWGTSGEAMTYSGAYSNEYSVAVWLVGGKVYGQDSPYNNDSTYGFKIYYNGEYYDSNNHAGDHFWITSTNTSTELGVHTGESNLWIQTGTYEGLYVFTFNTSDNTISVEYPGIAYYLLGLGSTNWLDKLRTDNSFAESREITDGTCDIENVTAGNNSYKAGQTSGFKIYCTDNTFYGKSSTTVTYSNYSTAQRLTNSTADSTNLGFTSWYSGTYTFNFNTSTKDLTVTPPVRNVGNPTSHIGSVSGTTVSGIASMTDNHNDTFKYTASDPTGTYQFVSWEITGLSAGVAWISAGTNTSAEMTLTVKSDAAITVKAFWSVQNYSVTLYSYGGSTSNTAYGSSGSGDSMTLTANYSAGSSLALPSAASMSPPAGHPTWQFVGWYTNTDFATTASDITTDSRGNKTYYAYWSVQVTFKDNIRDDDGTTNIIDTQTIRQNTSPVDPTTKSPSPMPTFDHYTFSSWNTSFTNVRDDLTVYAVYRPNLESFDINITSTGTTGAGTLQNPFVVNYGSVIEAVATTDSSVTIPSDITYSWSTSSTGPFTDGTFSNGQWSYTYNDLTADMTITGSSPGSITLYAKSSHYDERSPSQLVESTGTVSFTVYYIVDSPIQSFSFNPNQKIYNPNNTFSASIVVGFLSASDITGSTHKTKLKYFNPATHDYVYLTHDDSDLQEITAVDGETNHYQSEYTIDDFLENILNAPGVKYFKTEYWLDHDEDGTYEMDSSFNTELHTTVGTNHMQATHPLYMINSTSLTLSSYRIMAFYLRSGSIAYQTGTHYMRSTASYRDVYRFDIPDDVTAVTFVVFADSYDYLLPTINPVDSTLTLIPGYYEYASSTVTISNSTQAVRLTDVNNTTKSISAVIDTLD